MVVETSSSTIVAHSAARSPLGRVSMAGFIPNGRGIPERPFRVFGSYAVVYVIDGGGHYEDASGLKMPVRAGDLIIVYPDLPHTYGPRNGERWTELYLVFDGLVFDLWRSSGLLNSRRPIYHLEPIDYWAARFDGVLGGFRTPGFAPSLLEVCRLQTAIAEAITDGNRLGEHDEESVWVSRVCALLETDLAHDLDLRDVARSVNLSYNGFRKRFVRLTGMPPTHYRSLRVIDRACELMQQGRLNDRQIAEHLGFCDEYYFSRRFKQITGRSPRAWRENHPRPR
jgi:AraC-like DNA-binding protein